ncbi:MAG TPA: L,D-transpeptidase family protein [Acidimicrobiales bacterium]|nr:L,D-transpeptidase family protein [Acidimicrobiales bacterium]
MRHFPTTKDTMHRTARTFGGVAAAFLVATGTVACTDADGSGTAASVSSTTTTVEATTTTTVAPTTTTTTAKPIPAGLGKGSKGEDVKRLEERLATLKYDTGKIDGTFDATTAFAVMAFQKVHGLPRTGRATDDVVKALQTAGAPEPMMPTGGANRVEVDLKRQVLFLYQGGALLRILPVSTGNGKRYCVDGDCATAVTPGGSFRVTRKIKGLRVSRLGKLYNPLYFNGGIAIHGAPSVPAGPASHGCVRIPMATSGWFHDTVSTGTAVYVLGGRTAPVPFDEKAPGEAPSSTTTTTTVKPTTTTSSSTTSTTSTTIPSP